MPRTGTIQQAPCGEEGHQTGRQSERSSGGAARASPHAAREELKGGRLTAGTDSLGAAAALPLEPFREEAKLPWLPATEGAPRRGLQTRLKKKFGLL